MTHLALRSMPTKLTLWAAAVALVCMPLLSCGPAASIEAQAAVRESCSNTEAVTDMDVTTQMVSYDPELTPATTYGEIIVNVSGDDIYALIAYRDTDGLLLETLEVVKVDDVSYFRQGDDPWTTEFTFGEADFPYTTKSLCPDLGPVTRVGEETIDGISVTHYSFSVEHDLGPVGNVDDLEDSQDSSITDDDWDMWVDSSGTLIQTKRVLVSELDGELESKIELTSRFSGIGEANTITAPTIP